METFIIIILIWKISQGFANSTWLMLWKNQNSSVVLLERYLSLIITFYVDFIFTVCLYQIKLLLLEITK